MQNLTGIVNMQDGFTPALDNMANAMEGLLYMTQKVGAESGTAFDSTKVGDVKSAIDRMRGSLNGLQTPAKRGIVEPLKEGRREANKLVGTIKTMAGAYLGMQGLRLFKDQADTMNSIHARMNLMNDGLQTTNELMDMVYQSAQNSRGVFSDTADFVAKLGGSTKGVFASNEDLISFAETLNKQFAISGTTQAEQASAMLQLTQAMGSGVLRGEEFNAVLEASPGVIELIANEMGVTVGEMRALAGEGEITADIVKNAMLNSADEVNKKFESIPMTAGQAANQAKNRIQKAFTPLFNMFERAINSKPFMATMNGIIGAVERVVLILQVVGAVAGSVANYIYTNWAFFEPLFVAIGSALLAYVVLSLIKVAVQAVITAGTIISAFIAANLPIILIGALIGLVIYQFIQMGVTVQEVVGFIVGLVYALWAIIQNVFIFIYNLFINIIQGIINGFINLENKVRKTVHGIQSFFVAGFNAIKSVVMGVINSIISGLEGMVNKAISGLNTLIGFANNIPGVNIGTVGSVSLGRVSWDMSSMPEAPELIGGVDYSASLKDYQDYKGAFATGQEVGANFADNAITKAKDSLDTLGSKIDTLTQIPAVEDMQNSLGNLADDTGDPKGVKGNTKKTAEEVEKQREELKRTNDNLNYMKDLAERKAITNITWDKLDVKVSNSFGDVHEKADLDGWIGSLVEVLDEEINNGVAGGEPLGSAV